MRCAALLATAAILFVLEGGAMAGEFSVGAGASLDLGTGQLDLGGGDLSVGGTASAGSVAILGAQDVSIASGGVLNGDSATIQLCGDWSNAGTFNAGTSSVEFVDGCQSVATITGSSTFAGLSLSSTTGKQFDFGSGSTQTISGTLLLMGASGNRIVLRSTAGGSEAFLDVTGTSSADFVDVDDVHATGAPIVLMPGNSKSGSNAAGFVFVPAIPLLTPVGVVLLVMGLAWTARRTLAGRRSPAL